ncbi:MAG: RNA polymerase sigma factor [Gemmatimonadota bacterium]
MSTRRPSPSGPPDAVLIARVLDGDREPFRVLVERYQRAYLLYATRMVSSEAIAEDIVQDAFVTAFEKLATCKQPERFASWCFHIVRNRCHDHLRSPASRSAGSEPLDTLAAEGEDPSRVAERSDLRDAVLEAVKSLSPALREAFVLYHEQSLTYPEMAERLGASESALKMRVKRARDELQERLTAYRDHVRT